MAERVGHHGKGRVILTDSRKSHAGIADTVSLVGPGHTFQIGEPRRLRAHLKEATEQVRALKKRLGSQRLEPDAGARE
jgi:MraZ protein